MAGGRDVVIRTLTHSLVRLYVRCVAVFFPYRERGEFSSIVVVRAPRGVALRRFRELKPRGCRSRDGEHSDQKIAT